MSFDLSVVLVDGQVSLMATGSDPDGDMLSYQWDAPSGQFHGGGASTTWQAPGTSGEVTISVTVGDGNGGSASDTATIMVTYPWGAYAHSSDQRIYGVAAGEVSPGDAARAALADCQSKGGWGCTLGDTFQDQCFAVAHGLVTLFDPNPKYPSSYYQLYESWDQQTRRAAEQAAMYQCVRAGGGPLGTGTECQVLASICQP